MDFTPSWIYKEYRRHYEYSVTINKFFLINVIIAINWLWRNDRRIECFHYFVKIMINWWKK